MKLPIDNYEKEWVPLAISYLRWTYEQSTKLRLEQQWYCHETGETIWYKVPLVEETGEIAWDKDVAVKV